MASNSSWPVHTVFQTVLCWHRQRAARAAAAPRLQASAGSIALEDAAMAVFIKILQYWAAHGDGIFDVQRSLTVFCPVPIDIALGICHRDRSYPTDMLNIMRPAK